MQMKSVGYNKISYTFTKNELKWFGFTSERTDMISLLSAQDCLERVMSVIMFLAESHITSKVAGAMPPLMVSMESDEISMIIMVEAVYAQFKIFDFEDNYCEEIDINDIDFDDTDYTNVGSELRNESEFKQVDNVVNQRKTNDKQSDSIIKEKKDCLLLFKKLDDVIYYASSIPASFVRPKSELYKFESTYYLICDFSNIDSKSFNAYVMFASEGNTEIKKNVLKVARIMEHGEMIIKEKAIEKLAALI